MASLGYPRSIRLWIDAGGKIDRITLIDRARRFVEGENYTQLMPLLADCVAAQNSDGLLATKLLAADWYGGGAYNLLGKAPAAYCLLAWGEDGLKALVENALAEPKSKNVSIAFQILSSIAVGDDPVSIGEFVDDSQLRATVADAVGTWSALSFVARGHLHELMLSIEDDAHAAISTSTSLMTMAVQRQGAIRSLSHALALRSIAVGPQVLAAYNDLLVTTDDESIYQHFFEKHPLLLDQRAFQVWAKPDFHGRLEPDFLIRANDNSYMIVEIETPGKLLITQQGQLSAQATHAVRQVLEYQEYLRTHISAASETFPNFSPPTGLVVIGREASLDTGQKAALVTENRSRSDIRIVGFDTLSTAAEAVTSNVIHGIREVITRTHLA